MVDQEALWLDVDGKTFYAYNGGYSYSVQISEEAPLSNQLWQFTPSGSYGSWELFAPDPTANFSLLARAQAGLYASGSGLGFALGGSENAGTEYAWNAGGMNIPGMIMYNSSTLQWLNISSTGYSYDGSATNGAAQFVPDFGPEGLLFVFGGYAASNLVPFDTAFMFEPTTQQWRTQKVSGTPPSPVANPCVVGIAGDKGTYEVSRPRS